MASRAEDWIKQAGRDLEHAKRSMEAGDYEWACFAAQQSAKKALKAVYQKIGAEAWGHSVKGLLENLPENLRQGREDLLEMAKILDKYYIPTRYPNSFERGSPMDYFTKREAECALEHASSIMRFCERILGNG